MWLYTGGASGELFAEAKEAVRALGTTKGTELFGVEMRSVRLQSFATVLAWGLAAAFASRLLDHVGQLPWWTQGLAALEIVPLMLFFGIFGSGVSTLRAICELTSFSQTKAIHALERKIADVLERSTERGPLDLPNRWTTLQDR